MDQYKLARMFSTQIPLDKQFMIDSSLTLGLLYSIGHFCVVFIPPTEWAISVFWYRRPIVPFLWKAGDCKESNEWVLCVLRSSRHNRRWRQPRPWCGRVKIFHSVFAGRRTHATVPLGGLLKLCTGVGAERWGGWGERGGGVRVISLDSCPQGRVYV